MPAFTWPSTLYAVKCNGNKAYFHDIDRDTWQMDNINNGDVSVCNRILSVDVFGSESTPWIDFPFEDRIIDAAHGYGLPNLGKRGIAEVVSLSFTKVVTGMEGGMILTDSDELAEIATELRRLSGRMGEINARVAMQSIGDYELNRSLKLEVIDNYRRGININYTEQEVTHASNNSVYSILFAETSTRNAVMKALARNGVETKVYYDPLISGLPNTDYVYNHILSLPIHADVLDDQMEIIDIINKSAETTPGKKYLAEGWDK